MWDGMAVQYYFASRQNSLGASMTSQKRGPKPGRLTIEGNWEDAISQVVNAGPTPNRQGQPKVPQRAPKTPQTGPRPKKKGGK